MSKLIMLSKELRDERLAKLNDRLSSPWFIVDDRLRKEFIFNSFVEAVGFIVKVAIVAERMDHHPELSNNYKQVVCDLSTHSAGGITDLDFELAREIEQLN